MRILSELVFIPQTWEFVGYCMTFPDFFIFFIEQLFFLFKQMLSIGSFGRRVSYPLRAVKTDYNVQFTGCPCFVGVVIRQIICVCGEGGIAISLTQYNYTRPINVIMTLNRPSVLRQCCTQNLAP